MREVFGGTFCAEVTPQGCGHTSESIENYYSISLPIKGSSIIIKQILVLLFLMHLEYLLSFNIFFFFFFLGFDIIFFFFGISLPRYIFLLFHFPYENQATDSYLSVWMNLFVLKSWKEKTLIRVSNATKREQQSDVLY